MARRDETAPDFDALLGRFLAKYEHVPREYHPALGWLYVYQKVQDERKRFVNRGVQLSEGKRVFWAHLLGSESVAELADVFLETTTKAVIAKMKADGAPKDQLPALKLTVFEEREAEAARKIHAVLAPSTWYREVAVLSAHGYGMSDRSGTLTAAKILDAIASPLRFKSFGALIRYARLAPENGKAPRPTAGAKLHYSPKAWQALYDLTESWLKMPECDWRAKWDAFKDELREKYPDLKTHPKLRIHNMARRKVIRLFLRELWDRWSEWEVARKESAPAA